MACLEASDRFFHVHRPRGQDAINRAKIFPKQVKRPAHFVPASFPSGREDIVQRGACIYCSVEAVVKPEGYVFCLHADHEEMGRLGVLDDVLDLPTRAWRGRGELVVGHGRVLEAHEGAPGKVGEGVGKIDLPERLVAPRDPEMVCTVRDRWPLVVVDVHCGVAFL